MYSALPLGRLLVSSGLLTQDDLDEVLALQKTDGRRLGELLVERGLVRPHQLAQFLSHQLACPWVSLLRIEIAREAVDRLPRDIALRYQMVPVHLRTARGGATALYVAVDDPTDEIGLTEAAFAASMQVRPMVALASEIRTLLDRLYGPSTPTPVPPSHRGPFQSSPFFSSKDEPHGAARASRPPKPPPLWRPTVPPPTAAEELSILEEIDVVDDTPGSRPSRAARVVVVDTKEPFVAAVGSIAGKLGAELIRAPLTEIAKAAADHTPCAIVVTEEAYANERSGLDGIALEAGAQLIVASDQFQNRQLEGLLQGAVQRFRRSWYEKGTILEGRYELLRDLGGRLAGSRWEVRHVKTGRRSVLKVGVRAAHDDRDAKAVRAEQLALARVQHAGAVDLRDAGNTELGDPFIVVEMLEGRTLEALSLARGPLQTQEACTLIRQLANVLAAAHAVGVRHNEVKPENLLVVRDAWGAEHLKLVHWEAATMSEGTVDHRDDLAGLGACAFVALVGRARNEGESLASAGITPELAVVISRALGGDDRFHSVKELAQALEVVAPATVPSRLLQANPERRGTSINPAASKKRPSLELKPSELRRYRRAPYRTPVRVEVPGVGSVDGRSEDISEGGLFVVARGAVADGAEVTVRFALPLDGKVVSELGVVRWSRASRSGDGAGARAIGIELLSPGLEAVRQITRYVSYMSSGSK